MPLSKSGISAVMVGLNESAAVLYRVGVIGGGLSNQNYSSIGAECLSAAINCRQLSLIGSGWMNDADAVSLVGVYGVS